MTGLHAMVVLDFLEHHFDEFSYFVDRNQGIDEAGAREIIRELEKLKNTQEEEKDVAIHTL